MEEDLKKFLLQMKFTKYEIEDMKNLAPLLEVTTLEELKEVVRVLKHYGYPEEDLPELFYQNPNIMVMDGKSLAKELDKLVKQGIDIEEFLKTDPFGI